MEKVESKEGPREVLSKTKAGNVDDICIVLERD